MTALVGVLCSDGVVIGSDGAASFGSGGGYTIEQPCKKIALVGDHVIIAGTGQVGLGQRFIHLTKAMYDKGVFNDRTNDYINVGKVLSRNGLEETNATLLKPGGYGCLVAFSQGPKFYLLELAVRDFQPEFKTPDMPFCSLGSGQTITDPFLGFLRKVFFAKGPPNLQEGKFITIWALLHAIELNPGGVNHPIQVAVLKNKGTGFRATLLEEEELQEQMASVAAAEEHLRCYRQQLGGAVPVDIPEPPGSTT